MAPPVTATCRGCGRKICYLTFSSDMGAIGVWVDNKRATQYCPSATMHEPRPLPVLTDVDVVDRWLRDPL